MQYCSQEKETRCSTVLRRRELDALLFSGNETVAILFSGEGRHRALLLTLRKLVKLVHLLLVAAPVSRWNWCTTVLRMKEDWCTILFFVRRRDPRGALLLSGKELVALLFSGEGNWCTTVLRK